MTSPMISDVLRRMVRKTLWFIPVLFIITFTAFSIVNDEVPVHTLQTSHFDYKNNWTTTRYMAARDRHARGDDLPIFYFGIRPLSLPDTLNKVADDRERSALRHLGMMYGNWALVDRFHDLVLALDSYHHSLLEEVGEHTSLEVSDEITRLCIESRTLLTCWKDDQMVDAFKSIYQVLELQPYANQGRSILDETVQAYTSMKLHATKWKTWIPVVSLHFPNRYHYWLFGGSERMGLMGRGIIHGDLGLSTVDGVSVSERLLPRIGVSVLISLLGILLAYIISIPLGVFAAIQHDRLGGIALQMLMFFLYAMPPFVMAVVLTFLFANPGLWGGAAPLPSGGLFPVGGFLPDEGWTTKCLYVIPHLILPVFCYAYTLVALLSKMLDNSITGVLAKTYITTARAKGLDNWSVVGKHALKPGIYPLITMAGEMFPMLISGSVIIESIFNIPGMGSEIMRAYYRQDHHTMAAIMMMGAILTMFGFLFSDIMYVVSDPRVRIMRKQ